MTLKYIEKWYEIEAYIAKTYLEPCQTYEMDRFAKAING